MLETKAVFRRKDTEIEPTNCVVDKVIRLSGVRFDHFSRNLMREWDFIRDNHIDAVVDSKGRHRCLLVMGEGRRDGILINSEGAGYARYSAFLPNAEDLILAEQYPALSDLARRLTEAVAHIEKNSEAGLTIGLEDFKPTFGFAHDGELFDIFAAMLAGRGLLGHMDIDGGKLIFAPRHDSGAELGEDASVVSEKRPSTLAQIREAKLAPKQPRKAKAPGQNKHKGDAEL